MAQAASFRLSAEKIFTPLVTLAILIKQNPQLAGLEAAFPTIARQLLRSVNGERTVIQELQLSPMGVISMIYPKNNDTDTRLGINIFKQVRCARYPHTQAGGPIVPVRCPAAERGCRCRVVTALSGACCSRRCVAARSTPSSSARW